MLGYKILLLRIKINNYKQPLVVQLIDFAKTKPLHQENDLVKEQFTIVWNFTWSHFGPVKILKDICVDVLVSKFGEAIVWPIIQKGALMRIVQMYRKIFHSDSGESNICYIWSTSQLMLLNEIND